eukprot:CAMPEP_0175075262 /NCGR_PEP_ID=MMETSP0052_2-20121109/21881_1 /TAXON_ID=51329 ORGANISM="Polytomella parva, Strain SAG 63-3" /NCGR_SAMPLE_ID=MMETSP0052_2 /ASSEMBLY_ACC=CAM_ASM_000194 /LENGTH=155 /DNA_ID=CAMNT_0016343885 /DNA_START=88 /DNA_END=551 /DNA_ORIENTATION=+
MSLVTYPLISTPILDDSPKMYDLILGTGLCLRTARPCPGPWWPYYEITHLGIASMLSNMLLQFEQADATITIAPSLLNLSHPLMEFLFQVAINDIFDATSTLATVHEVIMLNPFNVTITLHIIVLVLCLLLFFGFVMFLVQPHLRRLRKEKQQIA